MAKTLRNVGSRHFHPSVPLNFNNGKVERQRNTEQTNKNTQQAIYTCKHSYIKQDKQWEASAVKRFGINPDLLRLGRILEVIIQGNKEKATDWIKWNSDVCLAV